MNAEFLKRMRKIQAEYEVKQKEIEKKEFVVEKQGITLVMLGTFKLKSLKIDEALIDPEDKELLEDLISLTLNEAIDLVNEEIDKLSPQLPGRLSI
ncbi:YbaB/EbfC family nucleoid-associated protein [Mycoplasmopsis synoviae]|uniref:YbaB/EbfC family nucleoid-associated protein n=1 Tax=Mycoplasmopsis synoviae TaxID=2109 RepID=UPI001CE0C062|nr:YbaB/EbfC family nucleoid-associated protein [Mycoplasmopsis synoviae]UBX97678.1 YbaB/EbfC family nucleoid-associated protein [Mycoplasmopsis synoviae]UBX98363.1 YbaB/EbfC family nucleoid-associated protein [Mycoplasmopsis synoviae]UBX98714.1 YbaB/EbfC family nucleoid-associated protein [Mycoplasmopsis synoviae]UBX99536.1 YbaB/EbfC family nucleoid-associated protein [Mycoplasmopsis synoviae]UBX99879.1 YbaB/EbfC family nucleoid-associated protein [Mycoplasmopsis synoviae]